MQTELGECADAYIMLAKNTSMTGQNIQVGEHLLVRAGYFAESWLTLIRFWPCYSASVANSTSFDSFDPAQSYTLAISLPLPDTSPASRTSTRVNPKPCAYS